MLTKEEVIQYLELNEKKEQMCNHIASIFKRFDEDYSISTTWDYYGGVFEGINCCIDPQWLSATDEELNQYADSVLEKRRREAEERFLRERNKRAEEMYTSLCLESLDFTRNERIKLASVLSIEELSKNLNYVVCDPL